MARYTRTIEFEEFTSVNNLPEDEQNLIAAAQKSLRYSYAPYSNFRVGAAALCKNGQIILGSNQETANFKGSCAEKVVLDSAGAQGIKDQIMKIAIVSGTSYSFSPDSQDRDESLPTPCGQCRQDIKEAEDLAGHPIVIILAGKHKVRRITGIANLLPFPFGRKDMIT